MAVPIEILIIRSYNHNMASKVRWLGILVVVSLALGWYSVYAQGETPPSERRYYPQHGHWVEGDFLKAYLNNPLASEVYGYPITPAFAHSTSGYLVQYFERARFELIQDNPPELRVKITDLGAYFYSPGGPELIIPAGMPACRHFPETGKKVCYTFLDYFEANGGAAQFGYPISNFEFQEERIVQYFQRARFEWHPELPHQQRVTLTDLGYRYFYKVNEDPELLLAEPWMAPGVDAPQPILNLRVRAFPMHAVTPQSGAQTIYVIVQDQNLLPISGAEVRLVITLPSEENPRRLAVPGRTNDAGIIHYTFDFKNQAPEVVQVQVSATFENFVSQTITSFRIWY